MLGEIDEGARKELPEGDYVAIYVSSHGLPDSPKDGAPGTVHRKRLGGRYVELVWPAWEKRIKEPDSWYAEVLKSVRDSNNEVRRRIVLISFLGDEV